MPHDLVIVANRLPVDRVELPDGSPRWRRSPGGLITAIEPVMRAGHGVWSGGPAGPTTISNRSRTMAWRSSPMSMSGSVRGDWLGSRGPVCSP